MGSAPPISNARNTPTLRPEKAINVVAQMAEGFRGSGWSGPDAMALFCSPPFVLLFPSISFSSRSMNEYNPTCVSIRREIWEAGEVLGK